MFEAFFPKITLPSDETDIRKGDGFGIRCGGIVATIDFFQGGEATKGLIAWLRSIGASQIDLAVATHAHGDHVFGLPGFLSTMGLLGRTAPLFIHGPSQLQTFVEFMKAHFLADMDYEIHFSAIDTTRHQVIFEDRSMEVWSLPLRHRLPCCGYLIKEKQGLPHIRREMIKGCRISVAK